MTIALAPKKYFSAASIIGFAFIIALMSFVFTSTAQAGWNNKKNKVSNVLDNNGFQTLLFALDTAGLTNVLDSNRVTVFGPTDDVFEATADALGCQDAVELATNLLNTPVGDSNALAFVLSYHAYLGNLYDDKKVLNAEEIVMVNAGTVTTGVNMNGLYVKGDVNSTASTITAGPFNAGWKSTVYAIDQILLPIDPTGICG